MDTFLDNYHSLIKLYKRGDFSKALEVCAKLLACNPNSIKVLNITGACYHALSHPDKALQTYQRIIDIDPLNANAYYNKGVLLHSLSSWVAAEECYQRVLEFDPTNYNALNNLGIILSVRGHYQAAFEKFLEAIAINTDSVNAICNAGLAKQNLGDFWSAIKFFDCALQKEPENYLATHCMLEVANLVELKNTVNSEILELDIYVRKIINSSDAFYRYNQPDLLRRIKSSLNFLDENNFRYKTQKTQIFSQNDRDLGCTRHKKLFSMHEIISSFCFGCFKVYVDPNSLVGLIQLAQIFYHYEFPKNVIMKTVVETREDVQGTYKGIIYCNSYEQSQCVMKSIHDLVNKLKYRDWTISMRRGCIEFSDRFPDFGIIDSKDPKFFQFPDQWHSIERNYEHIKQVDTNVKWPACAKFTLSDLLVIRNWIDYAKGLNDPTSIYFSEFEISNKSIFLNGKERSTA